MTLRSYNVIYDLVDDVRAAMEGRLNTVEERTEIGEAEVRLFNHMFCFDRVRWSSFTSAHLLLCLAGHQCSRPLATNEFPMHAASPCSLHCS